MSKYDFLKQLIDLTEEYEDSEGSYPSDIEIFSNWLTYRVERQNVELGAKPKTYALTDDFNKVQSNEAQISRHVGALYKFAKHYTKKILQNTPVNSIDEFGFLASLTTRQDYTKTELINQNLIEITSGTEIIKRLVKKNFAEESKDPDDGRGKRVRITRKGLEVVVGIFNQMGDAANIVSGNLTEFEKKQLIQILSKLEHFHHAIHENDRNSELSEIAKKYLSAKNVKILN